MLSMLLMEKCSLNVLFLSLLSLLSSAFFIYVTSTAYECKYKRVNGRVFVTKHNLFFYGKSFGVQTKVGPVSFLYLLSYPFFLQLLISIQKQVPFSQVAYVKVANKNLEVKLDLKLLKVL